MHYPRRIRQAIAGPTWGSMLTPVRTNLPYPGMVGGIPPGVAPFTPQGQLLTNYPDSWELVQGGPVPWSADVADDGRPPSWWVGQACDDGWSPIGPHGPNVWHHASLPVVTRAVSLIVDPLTAGVFRARRGPQSVPAPRWLSDPQLLRPDARFGRPVLPAWARLPRSVFWRRWIAQAVWWGRSFLLFEMDADDNPLAGTLRLVNTHLVDFDDDGRWRIGEDVVFDESGEVRFSGRRYRMRMLPNPHSPLGVFANHPDAFDYARKISRYGGRVFGNGVPAGYLKVTNPGLTQDQADQLKRRWMAAHGGERGIAVLNATTEFQPIAWSPVDTALAESYRLAIADVAYAFGMAPETLGVTLGNSATYSNVAQWFDAHRDFALSPWIAAVEGVLSSLLPDGLDVEVNLDQFTRPQYAERMDAHAVAIASGIRTVDEVRADEGFGPINETPEG